ncbi:MAG: L-aspartate oxidase [Lachnospiraceae bacterium]|nr:L-aspartate oxidase [Lachnospiraceae bacterium]
MKKADILIIGSGVSGLFCALNLPKDKSVLIISKEECEKSDSFLAQGGICMLKDESDYDSYFEDTMRAGHYENRKESVDIMIRSSQQVINDLVGYGVDFEKNGDDFVFTREGAHSTPRILFHKDITGKEITSKLLQAARNCDNITILEHNTMVDLICDDNCCFGVVAKNEEGEFYNIYSPFTVLATGGIGGLYVHSTNFRHLTGDSLGICMQHNIKLEHIDYVQIHPTTLYEKTKGRRFLISESVRGEGAVLLNNNGERFTDELQPRDVVVAAIREQMKKDNMPYVWLSMKNIPNEEIKTHFPNIFKYCLEHGYDVTSEPIPVVPAQHYFMGGVWVDSDSKTSCDRLYAVGETSCNGVHGKNRLASNSLLESLVFAKRAAQHIVNSGDASVASADLVNKYEEKLKNNHDYFTTREDYVQIMRKRIEDIKEKNSHE